MRHAWPVLLVLMLPFCLLGACGQERVADSYDPAHDYFSFANTGEFTTRHLELDLEVDFAATELRGSVVLHMNRIAPAARTVVLDSRGLVIGSVQLLQPGGDALELAYQLGETDPVKGEPLVINLPDDFAPTGEFRLRIQYHTGPNASALMWLPAELTAGGAHPFMFTQSQSIHARSWVPLQDTPGMRVTYEAIIIFPCPSPFLPTCWRWRLVTCLLRPSARTPECMLNRKCCRLRLGNSPTHRICWMPPRPSMAPTAGGAMTCSYCHQVFPSVAWKIHACPSLRPRCWPEIAASFPLLPTNWRTRGPVTWSATKPGVISG
jgi:hypothetical protein